MTKTAKQAYPPLGPHIPYIYIPYKGVLPDDLLQALIARSLVLRQDETRVH